MQIALRSDIRTGSTETIYDAAGRVVGTDRVSGLVITVSTNAAGVASATVTNSGTVVSTTSQILNAAGQVLSSTGPDGQTTTFTYNALGQQTGSTLPNGGTTSTVYDALGRKVSQTDPNGLKTSYVYDAAGDLIQTNYADGTSTSATYDGVGNKLTSTDQMNQVTTYSYNVAGQILTVTEPPVTNPATGTLVNPVTTYSYDQFGDEISSTSPNGNVAGGNPAAYTTTYQYDSFGNQTSKTLPALVTGNPPPVTSSTYDAFGRTLTTTDADGQVTLYLYDSASAALPELNADGSATTNTYSDSLVPAADQSNLGRLYAKFYFDTVGDYNNFVAGIGQSPPSNTANPNETVVYAYYTAADVQNGVTGAFAGSVKSITDNLIRPAAGDPRSPYTNVTTFQYDSNNNVVQESGPSGTINYVYNTATQRHTEIPARRDTDYANAVTDIVYGYNNMGELASVTVLKENGQTPAAVASSTLYDAIGGTSTTTLPNTVYTYDAGGRLETTLDSATGITTKYTYKPDTSYVQTETVTNAAGTTLASYTYSYRNDGLKTGETDVTLNTDGTTYDTRTLSWTYDGLDRLTQEKSVESAQSVDLNYTDNYSYDLNSNRTGETEDQGNTGSTTDTITSTYNADDELTKAVDANTGTTVYGYDANGSQTSVTHTPNGTTTPDRTTANEYDLQGQLAGSQVTTSAGTANTTYYYDDSGNPDNNLSPLEIGTGLLEEINLAPGGTTPVTTYYLVDTDNPTGYSQPIEQAATPGTPQITYVWGAQLISETYTTGATIPGVGTASSPTTYYLLQGAHGSTRLVTDATGNIVARYNYDGFGNALGFNAATALTTYLYSSMPFDAASGNYYDHARFYDSGTGGFTQADYGYSGSLNNPMSDLPYMFAGGDPINMLDLSGHAFGLVSFDVSFSFQAQLSSIDISAGSSMQLALQGVPTGATESEVLTEFVAGQLFGAAAFAAAPALEIAGGFIGSFAKLEVVQDFFSAFKSVLSGINIDATMTSDEANAAYIAAEVSQGKNAAELADPFMADTLVAQGRTSAAQQFVRVYNPAADAKLPGAFMTTLSQIRGMTAQQIREALALPYLPTDFTYVNVPVGTMVRVGRVAPSFGAGGALQVQLLQEIDLSNFTGGGPISGLLGL